MFDVGIRELSDSTISDWARHGSLEGELAFHCYGEHLTDGSGNELIQITVWISKDRKPVCLLTVRREISQEGMVALL